MQELCKVEGLDVNILSKVGCTALHYAANEGHTGTVQELCKVEGLDVNILSNKGLTALHYAASRGHTGTVQELCKVEGLDVNILSKEGWTALHYAASRGHTGTVQELCKVEGLDVNILSDVGRTALHCAANEGHAGTVQELCKVEGLDVNILSDVGRTALHCAANEGHTVTVQELCKVEGLDVNILSNKGLTALHYAANEGHTHTVQELCKVEGLDVNILSNKGLTALHCAANEGHTVTVQELCKVEGLDVNILSNKGLTALHYAASRGHTGTVQELCKVEGLDVNILSKEGWTALHYAASRGHTGTVQELCKVEGLDVNILSDVGRTALHCAANEGHAGTVQELCKVEGLDVNILSDVGRTALHCAANEGHTGTVQELCKVEGLDVNILSNKGLTALHCAANEGHTGTVQELCKVEGLDVNILSKEGLTALHYAASRGHTGTVQELCKVEGLDVNILSKEGWTALHYAASRGHTGTVQELCKVEGLDVNILSNKGRTALHCAANEGHTGTVQELCKVEGLDVNILSKEGWTALHYAASRGHTGTVQELCKVEGLDVNILDTLGCTALHCAAESGNEEVMKLLITHPSTDVTEVQRCADDPRFSFIFFKGNLYTTILTMFVEQSEVSKRTSLIKLFYTIVQAQAKCDEAKKTVLKRLFKDDLCLLEGFIKEIDTILECEERDDEYKYLQLIAGKIKTFYPYETSGFRCCPSKKPGKDNGHRSDSVFHKCYSRGNLSVVFCILGIFFYTSDLFTDFSVGMEDLTSGFSTRLGIFEIFIVVFTLAHENINSAVSLYSTEEELLKMCLGKARLDGRDWESSSDLNFNDWLPIRVIYQVLWPYKIRTLEDGKWMKIKALRGLTFNLLSLVCFRPVVDRLNVLLHTPTGLRANIRQQAKQNSLKQYYLILEQIPQLLIQFYVFQIIFNDISDKVMVECRDTFNYNNKLNNSEDNLFCNLVSSSSSCGVLFRVYSMSIPFFTIPSGMLSLEGNFRLLDPATPKMTKSTKYLTHAAYIMMVPARLFVFAGLMHAVPDQLFVTIYIICRIVVELIIHIVAYRGYEKFKKLWSSWTIALFSVRNVFVIWTIALFSLRNVFVISLRRPDAYLGSPSDVSYHSLHDWRRICLLSIPYFIEGLIGAVLMNSTIHVAKTLMYLDT